MRTPSLSNLTVGVLGLGYVGLPLAIQIATTKINKQTKKQYLNHFKSVTGLKNLVPETGFLIKLIISFKSFSL